jgi:hypothetical protein
MPPMSDTPIGGPEFRPEPWQEPLPDVIPNWAQDPVPGTVQDAIPGWAQHPQQYPPQYPLQYPLQYPPQMYPGYYGPPWPRTQTSSHAITGIILGGLSLFLCVTPFGPVLSITGIVFSLIGLSQSSRTGYNGTGLAVTGLVCSTVTLLLWMVIAVLLATIVF